MISGT
jgi:hypothetical protein